MSQSRRIAIGGLVDRTREIKFRFDGIQYKGHPGDTLASALLANDVRVVGRSFKYHRPRGIVAAGVEEPNALVQLGEGTRSEPNTRATLIELHEDLVAHSQNCWPSLRWDLGAVTSLFSSLFPAGFYYKTFMWPPKAWRMYERYIRKMAGLGKAPTQPDTDRYEKRFAHCDVLVVGAGPAGLCAARSAAASGARVILADEQATPGGSLLSETVEIDGKATTDWIRDVTSELTALPEVTLLLRTTVSGYYNHNFVVAVERVSDHLATDSRSQPRQRLWKIRAGCVVLATGSIERPLVFPGNDTPGVMLAGSARTYVCRYGVRPGNRAVIFTNNNSAYRAALDCKANGIEIAAVVDSRETPDGAAVDAIRSSGIDIHTESYVSRVRGRSRVEEVEIRSVDPDMETTSRTRCDLVMMSGGWNPTVHLASQSGTGTRWDDDLACFVPTGAVQNQFHAGAVTGVFDLPECMADGARAGVDAVESVGGTAVDVSPPTVVDPAADDGYSLEAFWRAPASPSGDKMFLDFQNDVTASDIALAHRENYASIEHCKRYTTTGMGTDQGKTSNVNGLAILAGLSGSSIPETGHTTFRPFFTPVTIGALAGIDTGPELLDPIRTTPMHRWHHSHGAKFEDVGQWKRPYCYLRDGESVQDAVNREVLGARTSVAVLDASTLGKIDVQGPDAPEFLDRIYTNMFSSLKVGACRYGLMCHDDGMVFDDGVTARIGENHYLMSTTTGGAANVLNWLEEWLQTEWTDLHVYCTSVTTCWAAIAIAGPHSRALLQELVACDLSNDAFPFMTWQDATVAGIPARLFRISFSGETGFEVHVPSTYALSLWQTIFSAGEKYNVMPYGTEAMHVLRAEKGFIIAGQDTDGTTTPFDLGMNWIVSKKKSDFLGKRGMARPDTLRDDRKQLVGLLTDNPEEVIPEGAHVSPDPRRAPPVPMEGWVSSSYYSPNCQRSIALALVKRGHERMGEKISIPVDENRIINATIVKPVFFDEEGTRLRG